MSRTNAASAITDIANFGIQVKVGMGPAAHKTVALLMRYVFTKEPVLQAVELVANRREARTGTVRTKLTLACDLKAALAGYRRALVSGVEAQMKTPAQGRGEFLGLT